MPGFIDVHAHWNGFGAPYPAKSWEMETFLAYGVTTLHKYVPFPSSSLNHSNYSLPLAPVRITPEVSGNGPEWNEDKLWVLGYSKLGILYMAVVLLAFTRISLIWTRRSLH